ncbi:acetyl-CoA C-acyltransferase [Tissierella praeacuta]|uniref:thiolase family protein n=1 Tax=Tissierella praeacuta TaxID=43131 RepID=UPI0035167845
MRDAVIVAYGRSAIGKSPRGKLSKIRPEDLGAQVFQGVLDKVPNLDRRIIDDIIVGCAFPEGEQGFNIGRIIGQRIGIPNDVPGQTVNRFCSSGLQTIATGANAIMAGQANIILAGGIESMSSVPMGGNFIAPDPYLMANNKEVYINMGLTAENVAEKYNISRKIQDEFAEASHRKAFEALKNGKFKDDIIPIKVEDIIIKGEELEINNFIFTEDEGIRPNTSVESLSKLKAVFKNGGTVTAGNSSQMSDGASAVLLMAKDKADELGIKPLAKFVSFAVGGVAPELMGLGPIAAIPKALKLAGLTLEQINLIELNEAFASQAIACINELGMNKQIINVNGGAIALGHPLGCTGSFLTTKLLSEMRRRDDKYGLVSMCIGGGMGAAAIFELIV